MKGKISTGIWFIFFGIIALLHNFNVINFNFWAILPYWPLLIITLGANLIFQNKKNGTLILSILNFGICFYLGFVGMTSTNSYNILNNINNSKDITGTAQTVNSPFTADIQEAKLTINAGALSLKMDTIATIELLEAKTDQRSIGLKLSRSGESNKPTLELNTIIKNENKKNNNVIFALNKEPIWQLELNIGAAAFAANLSEHKFSSMEINAGAASVYLKLGEPTHEVSNIEINTAASTCKIDIPDKVACRVEASTFLSSRKLDGFEKNGDYYQTVNYETAAKKYHISIDGAANSLKINRY